MYSETVQALKKPFDDRFCGKSMTVAERMTLDNLRSLYEKFQSPSEDDLKKLTVFSLDENEDQMLRVVHFTEMISLSVFYVGEFASGIPVFSDFSENDKITLIRACLLEMLLLWSLSKYHKESESIVLGNNYVYGRDCLRAGTDTDFSNEIFDLLSSLQCLKIDKDEYALLSAILLFTQRKSLEDPDKVKKLQEAYIGILRKIIYLDKEFRDIRIDRLTSNLSKLYELCDIGAHKWLLTKIEWKHFSPLLKQLLGLNSAD